MTATNLGSQLCLTCGICCQGVLFFQDESPENYAIEPGQDTQDDNKNPRLPLTCPLFRGGRCVVHEDPRRPPCCRACQCQLLKRLLRHEISLEEGQRIIEGIKSVIDQIIRQWPHNDGSKPLIGIVSDARSAIQRELASGDASRIELYLDMVSLQRRLHQYILPVEGV